MKKNDKRETSAQEEKKAPLELNLDDLDAVQGGSLGNVSYSGTSSISQSTRDNI